MPALHHPSTVIKVSKNVFLKKKKKVKRKVGGVETGNAGLLRVIHLISTGLHNLDVTIFSAHIQIYNLPAKEMEMPNLLLGGGWRHVLKGPERGKGLHSANLQDREPVLRSFAKLGSTSLQG